jgi:pSer/pThr/pTyr-binding forkhead associated (FHA) protein
MDDARIDGARSATVTFLVTIGTTARPPAMATLLIVGVGIVHEIPKAGLVIGRDPECGIVLDSREVSRRHARVESRDGGHWITDDSTNGVFVNGERASRSQQLSDGDVVQVGDVTFRFSAGGVTHAGSVIPGAEVDAILSSQRDDLTPTAPLRRAGAVSPLDGPALARLDVLEGNVPRGMRFELVRPVAQLGRGAACDVCLLDDTVSGAHATLMLRAGVWYLLDHASFNGTYVDGVRVNQCALPGECELRLGGVRLRFQPASA